MAPGCLSVKSTAGQQTKSTSSAAGSLMSHAQVLKQEQWRVQPDWRLHFKLKTLSPLQDKAPNPFSVWWPCETSTKVVIFTHNGLIY